MNPRHLPTAARLVIALLVSVLHAQAQNLVTNPGFEAGITGFTTDYTLWAGQPGWGANLYYVTNNPRNAFSGWAASGDHTTGAGKMLIVDGSTTAGRVFWRQTVPVAANTTYVFSAWGLKFDSGSPPILYFTVNGVQQDTFYVLPLAPSGWQGYGVTWSSGAATTALLELRLQSTLGVGNNLAVDEVALVRSADVPAPLATVAASAQVGWLSYPGLSSQVQWRTQVDPSTWFNLGGPLVGNGMTNYVCDPLGTNERKFYQVLRLD